jgi:hypothetical protein
MKRQIKKASLDTAAAEFFKLSNVRKYFENLLYLILGSFSVAFSAKKHFGTSRRSQLGFYPDMAVSVQSRPACLNPTESPWRCGSGSATAAVGPDFGPNRSN